MRSNTSGTLFSVASLVLISSVADAQQSGFGGPNAVENTIASDREQVDAFFTLDILDPYFEFKAGLEEDIGLSFGTDYTALAFAATDSAGDDSAASGIARVFGSWTLLGRDTPNAGSLVFKGEHRHGYTDVAPGGFGFETGYVGLYNAPFSDQGPRMTNLYWKQKLLGGRATVTAGFLDTTDYVDAYALANPWTHFGNFAFSTGSATISLPDDATLGIAAAAFLTDNIYAIAGMADANADSADIFRGFETFFDDREYFSSIEIGYTTAPERLIFDNVHVTAWHTDGSQALAVNNGWGINASATWYIEDQWMPFLRAGYADDGGSLLERSISVGLGWQPEPGPGRDVVGVGLNWGQPNADTFGPGLDDQWTGEMFYRFNLGKQLALTPSVQLVSNPALNPTDDFLAIFGLRTRLAL